MHRLISFAMLSLFLFSCTTNNDPATAGYWVAKLEDKKQRTKALKELGKIGDKTALPDVIRWFEKRGAWQPNAAYTLGKLGDLSVVPTLIAGIDYEVGTGADRRTRAINRTNLNIAKALDLLGAKDSAPALVRLLNTPDLSTREGVMRTLGHLGNPAATDELIKIATTESQPFLRKVAIQALGDLGDPKAIPALIQGLYTELPGVSFYFEARHSLLQAGSAAIPALVLTLERKNQAVENIRLPSGKAIADGAIEGKAAFVLGALRATETLPQLVTAMKKYHAMYKNRRRVPVFASVPAAVSEIVYSLGIMGDPRAVAPLLELVREPDSTIRVAAARALAEVGDAGVVNQLFKYARSSDSTGRKSLITTISLLGSGTDLKAFDQLGSGTDKASTERAKTTRQLRARLVAAGMCKSDMACWKQKLKDPDDVVRERAASELGRANHRGAVQELLGATEDDAATVRIAAINALRKTGGVDVAKLETIHTTWAKKIDYKDANLALKTLIAVLQTQS